MLNTLTKEFTITMKRLVSALLLTLLLVLSFSAIKAADSVDDQGNPNDPTANDRANACYDGGTLEGKCDSDLLWQAGWYLIRFEHGSLSRADFPGWLIWVLPPEVKVKYELVGGGTTVDMTCYIEVGPGVFESTSTAVLNGANGGNFVWTNPTTLINSYSNWLIWTSGGGFATGYYGDCSPLGIGSPAPTGIQVI
jgi:hypothetical protein